MKECNTIGERIRALREEKGLTQQQLAKALYTSRVNVNYWENDERNIKSDIIIALAEFFDVSCDYLLTGISSKNIGIYREFGLDDDAVNNIKTVEKHFKGLTNKFIKSNNFIFLMNSIREHIKYQCKNHDIKEKKEIQNALILEAGYKQLCHNELDDILGTMVWEAKK